MGTQPARLALWLHVLCGAPRPAAGVAGDGVSVLQERRYSTRLPDLEEVVHVGQDGFFNTSETEVLALFHKANVSQAELPSMTVGFIVDLVSALPGIVMPPLDSIRGFRGIRISDFRTFLDLLADGNFTEFRHTVQDTCLEKARSYRDTVLKITERLRDNLPHDSTSFLHDIQEMMAAIHKEHDVVVQEFRKHFQNGDIYLQQARRRSATIPATLLEDMEAGLEHYVNLTVSGHAGSFKGDLSEERCNDLIKILDDSLAWWKGVAVNAHSFCAKATRWLPMGLMIVTPLAPLEVKNQAHQASVEVKDVFHQVVDMAMDAWDHILDTVHLARRAAGLEKALP